MIIVASSNGAVGMAAGMDILRSGGSAIDAVEAACRLVEANPEDHSVGYNGYPNILGELELDASIMDGKTLGSGAVAGMKGYTYAITVARQVMEKLPHVLLVGDGAARFAAEMGHSPQDRPYDDEIDAFRHRHLKKFLPAGGVDKVAADGELWRWASIATDPRRTYGTVNFIAQDGAGDICTAVSTSGWAWKYPGRAGDSPIIGAGNYADNRYGGAACTGMGEMAIRACTAHSVVFYMKMGMSVQEAGEQAMVDLLDLQGDFISGMNLIALDKDGTPAAFSSYAGKTYIYQRDDMEMPAEIERSFVAIESRWKDNG